MVKKRHMQDGTLINIRTLKARVLVLERLMKQLLKRRP